MKIIVYLMFLCRFITPREFGRVMHRACQREVAMCEADPQQQQQVHCGAQPEAEGGSASALSPQQLPSKVSGVDGTGYNEQSLAALLQVHTTTVNYSDTKIVMLLPVFGCGCTVLMFCRCTVDARAREALCGFRGLRPDLPRSARPRLCTTSAAALRRQEEQQ